MTSKTPVRVADDVDETALSYSEIKALATGNPLIIEKCSLDMDVSKLRMLKANFQSQKYELEMLVVRKYPQALSEIQQRIEGYEADIARAAEYPKPAEGFVGITIDGKTYADKEEAGKMVLDVCIKMTGSDAVYLGQYRGFSATIAYDAFRQEYRISLKGQLSHSAILGADIFGNFTRMDNVLDSLPKKLAQEKAELEETTWQFENAKAELETPFSREEELTQKEQRLKELNILLNMDEKDDTLIDEAPEEGEDKPKSRSYER